MSFVAVVETAGRRQVQPVTLTPDEPVRVGRGWQNDVIVDDEYGDADHLAFTIDGDGAIRVTDLGTRNGSRLAGRRLVGGRDYRAGTALTIGDSTVTLHDATAEVVPALKLDAVHVASRRFGALPWVVLATALAVAGLGGSAWYGSALEATRERLASTFLGAVVFAVAWCLVAGLVGKLFRNRTHFRLHWMHLCLAVAFAVGGGLLVDVLRFNLAAHPVESFLTHGPTAVMLLLFGYGTLSLCTRLGGLRKLGAAAVLALLPTAFALLGTMFAKEHERWTYVANVDRVILPPVFRIGTPVTLDAHLSATDALFGRLDAEVGTGAPASGVVDDPDDGNVRLSGID